MAFGLDLLCLVKEGQKARWRGTLGAWMLVIVAVLGLSTNLFFPVDPHGAPAAFTGTVHLVLAGPLSLGSILATLLVGLWIRSYGDFRGYGTYTLITCAIIFLSGGFTALTAATASPSWF